MRVLSCPIAPLTLVTRTQQLQRNLADAHEQMSKLRVAKSGAEEGMTLMAEERNQLKRSLQAKTAQLAMADKLIADLKACTRARRFAGTVGVLASRIAVLCRLNLPVLGKWTPGRPH